MLRASAQLFSVPMSHSTVMFTYSCILFLSGFLIPLSCALPKERDLGIPDVIVIEDKLAEELPLGHSVLNLNKAVAMYDTRQNSSQHHAILESRVFTLIPAEQHEYFSVSPSHDLVVIKRIDREALCGAVNQEECLLRLQMAEQNTRTRLRTIFIRLILEDINDNRPICQPPHNALKDDQHSIPTIEVFEDVQLNEVLASWTVTDPDTSKYGIYGFRQILTTAHDHSGDLFSLDLSTLSKRPWSKVAFQLRLNRPLEKQSFDNPRSSKFLGEFLIKYTVWDSPDEPNDYNLSYRTVCHLRILVVDVNNNSPEWVSPQEFKLSQPIQIDLKEGGIGSIGRNSHILKLEARDRDIGPNALIQYQMMPVEDKGVDVNGLLNNFLQLDSRTGILRIRRFPLDYETLSLQLPLRQTNPSGKEAAGIRFFVKAVDSPKDESHQRSSPLGEVVLYIHDVNDSPPKITVLPIAPAPSFSPGGKKSMGVRENLPALEPVAIVSVEDADTSSGGRVECDLLESPSKNVSAPHFRLIKTTFPEWTTKQSNVAYQILTTGPLDRETQSSHKLRLICIDGEGTNDPSEPRLTSVVSIFVRVIDENDCAPIISPTENDFLADRSAVVCKVVENAQLGSKICQLKALDADEGENAIVEWMAGNDVPSWLKVDPTSGRLMVSGPGGPDRETAERHNFSIILVDGKRGSNRLSTTVDVSLEVIDVNDHVPEIGQFFYFAVSELAPPGTLIGRLNATDRDKEGTDNALITYTIAGVRPYDPSGMSSFDLSKKLGTWAFASMDIQKAKIPVVVRNV